MHTKYKPWGRLHKVFAAFSENLNFTHLGDWGVQISPSIKYDLDGVFEMLEIGPHEEISAVLMNFM